MQITEYKVEEVVIGVCTCKHCGTNTGDSKHNSGCDTWLHIEQENTEAYDVCTSCAMQYNLLLIPF